MVTCSGKQMQCDGVCWVFSQYSISVQILFATLFCVQYIYLNFCFSWGFHCSTSTYSVMKQIAHETLCWEIFTTVATKLHSARNLIHIETLVLVFTLVIYYTNVSSIITVCLGVITRNTLQRFHSFFYCNWVLKGEMSKTW